MPISASRLYPLVLVIVAACGGRASDEPTRSRDEICAECIATSGLVVTLWGLGGLCDDSNQERAELARCTDEHQSAIECSERYPPQCVYAEAVLDERCNTYAEGFWSCVADDPLVSCVLTIDPCEVCVCQACPCEGECLEQHRRWRECRKACTVSSGPETCREECDAQAEPELRTSLDCFYASGSATCTQSCAP